MNCIKCNTAIPLNGKFCPNCGNSVEIEKPCIYCSAPNPLDALFCSTCGKTQTLAAHSPSEKNQLKSGQIDFAYLINEEKILAAEAGKTTRVPYGYVAVTLVNGEVIKIQEEEAYKNNKDNSVIDFFKAVKNFLNELKGQQKVSAKTYVLMNLSELPILNYSYPVPVLGAQNGMLNFQFWVEAKSNSQKEAIKHLGLFIQKTMANKLHISLTEIRSIAVDNIPDLVKNYTHEDLMSPAYWSKLSEMLKSITGISSRCVYQIGKSTRRRYLDISKKQSPISCINCSTKHLSKINFCDVCGNDLTKLNWIDTATFIQTINGTQVTVRISMNEDESSTESSRITDEIIVDKVMNCLLPLIRKRDVLSLMSASSLQNLSSQLNIQLTNDFQGYLTDFTIVDIRTTEEDWFFKTDSLVSEELRKLESDSRFLQIEDSKIDYAEAAFAIAIRAKKQVSSQELIDRKHKLETRIQTAGIEIQELELDTSIKLKQGNIEDQIDQENLKKQTAKLLRDTNFQRSHTQFKREDEISETNHEMGLEKLVAKHDIDLADMASEAQSRAKRRELTEETAVEDEKIRLEAKREEEKIRLEVERKAKLGHIDEDIHDRQNSRSMEKWRTMGEIESMMTQQESDNELNKVKLEGDIELKRLAEMKGRNAQEILAMQVVQAIKAGDPSQSSEIIKSVAESNAAAASAHADVKVEMYKQMLQNSDVNSKAALESQKSASDIVLRMSEKTIETMSKVAVVAATGRNSSNKDNSEDKNSKLIHCKTEGCGNTFKGNAPKFCSKCGKDQHTL